MLLHPILSPATRVWFGSRPQRHKQHSRNLQSIYDKSRRRTVSYGVNRRSWRVYSESGAGIRRYNGQKTPLRLAGYGAGAAGRAYIRHHRPGHYQARCPDGLDKVKICVGYKSAGVNSLMPYLRISTFSANANRSMKSFPVGRKIFLKRASLRNFPPMRANICSGWKNWPASP